MSHKNQTLVLFMLSLLVLGILFFRLNSQSLTIAASTNAVKGLVGGSVEVETETVMPTFSSVPTPPTIPAFFTTIAEADLPVGFGPDSGSLPLTAIPPATTPLALDNDQVSQISQSSLVLVNSVAPVCPFEDTPTLKSGDTGAEVEELQKELRLFNPELKVSSKFDSATQNTLRRLGTKLGVPVKSGGVNETVKNGLCRVFYQCGRPNKVTVVDPDGTTFYKGKYYPRAIAWMVELKELPILRPIPTNNAQDSAAGAIRYCPLQHDLYLMNRGETIGQIPFDDSINASQKGYSISFPLVSLEAPWRVPELMDQRADVPDGSNYTVKVVTTGYLGGQASGESKPFTIASGPTSPKPPSCRDCDALREQLLGLLRQMTNMLEQMKKLLNQ